MAKDADRLIFKNENLNKNWIYPRGEINWKFVAPGAAEGQQLRLI